MIQPDIINVYHISQEGLLIVKNKILEGKKRFCNEYSNANETNRGIVLNIDE